MCVWYFKVLQGQKVPKEILIELNKKKLPYQISFLIHDGLHLNLIFARKVLSTSIVQRVLGSMAILVKSNAWVKSNQKDVTLLLSGISSPLLQYWNQQNISSLCNSQPQPIPKNTKVLSKNHCLKGKNPTTLIR